MHKIILIVCILLINFGLFFAEDNLSIQSLLAKTKEKKLDVNDREFLKDIEKVYSQFWQAKDKNDLDKIQVSLELLTLVHPFMNIEAEKLKIQALNNLILTNLGIAIKEKRMDEKNIKSLEAIIGSNKYKLMFIQQSKIGTELNIVFENPILKIKELSKSNILVIKEFSQICNDVDFYLFDKEKTLENKLELIQATFELSKNINEITKNESDKTKVGWYIVINETMRENSLKYLIEFQSDVQKSKVIEKYMSEFKKLLSEEELKTLIKN